MRGVSIISIIRRYSHIRSGLERGHVDENYL
jgi:hypothetical protein